jgi:choline-sulfatase
MEVFSLSMPNIVFIVSDQHRGDWMGCAGHPYVRTPNLDRMATQGIRFTEAHCNAPLCVPSRMSMMTGKFPHRLGVYSNGEMLASDVPTFAHALGLAGYETVLSGRMHFVGPDQRHGYQERLVGDITPSYPGGPATDYGPLEGTQQRGYRSIELAGPGDSPVLQFDEEVTLACEEFLRERAERAGQASQVDRICAQFADQSDQSEHRPLFLTVGYYGPHTPYTCPPNLFEQALADMEGKDFPVPRKDTPRHPWMDDWFKHLNIDDVTPDQIRTVRAAYAGSIAWIDSLVGRVLEAAKSLPGDTYVIYCSDHGEMAGDRHMFWKQSFYEGAVKIPMIAYPLKQEASVSKWQANRMVEYPVSLVDMAPTLIALAGAPELPGIDGVDLSGLLLAEPERNEELRWMTRPIFAELNVNVPVRMIRQYEFKLIYYDEYRSFQMFNVIKDPRELIDLASDPDYEELAQGMLDRIFEDWDPERVKQDMIIKKAQTQYMRNWGKQVGMGAMDLWNQISKPDYPDHPKHPGESHDPSQPS